jgi:hypothetical protein
MYAVIQPSPIVSSTSTKGNLNFPSTSIANGASVSAEHSRGKQELELKHPIPKFSFSPQPSPTPDEYIEKTFRFSKF